jgi:hypothetical protein
LCNSLVSVQTIDRISLQCLFGMAVTGQRHKRRDLCQNHLTSVLVRKNTDISVNLKQRFSVKKDGLTTIGEELCTHSELSP